MKKLRIKNQRKAIPKTLTEKNDCIEKLPDIVEKPDSKNENTQEIVASWFSSNISEGKSDDNEQSIRAIPNISKTSDLLRETLGSLMKNPTT